MQKAQSVTGPQSPKDRLLIVGHGCWALIYCTRVLLYRFFSLSRVFCSFSRLCICVDLVLFLLLEFALTSESNVSGLSIPGPAGSQQLAELSTAVQALLGSAYWVGREKKIPMIRTCSRRVKKKTTCIFCMFGSQCWDLWWRWTSENYWGDVTRKTWQKIHTLVRLEFSGGEPHAGGAGRGEERVDEGLCKLEGTVPAPGAEQSPYPQANWVVLCQGQRKA